MNMKKLTLFLVVLALLTCFGCTKEEPLPEPEPEPVAFSDPINLLVRKDSKYEDLEGLKETKIGIQKYMDSEYMDYVKSELINQGFTEENFVDIDTYQEIPDYLRDEKIEAWILPDGYDSVMNDYRYDYVPGDYKVLASFRVPYFEEQTLPENILTDPLYTEPFALVINGLDGIGENDAKDLRNDVTHVMVVDPVKRHVLTISFPRDSYVYNTTYKYKDKLTHMNVYGGAETIIDSLSKLLDINIRFYCVTTFDHFCDIINMLGGVWIDVPMDVYMDMDSHRDVSQPYEMSKGYKKVYGEWALALARNRKYNNIAAGDYSRIRNQALIINSIIAKIAKYPFILEMSNAEWYFNIFTNNNFTDFQVKVLLELAKSFSEGYTIDNYFIMCNDMMLDGAFVGVIVDDSLNIAKGKAKLVLTGEVDEKNPYYEQIMTGYVSAGAGVSGDGGNRMGFIGTEYDLSEIYPQQRVE